MKVVLLAEGEVPNRLPLPDGDVPSREAPPAPPTTAEGTPAGGRQGGSPLPSRLAAGGEVPGGGRAGWDASCSSWMARKEVCRPGGLLPAAPPQAAGGGDALSLRCTAMGLVCMKLASDRRSGPPPAPDAAVGDSRAGRVLTPVGRQEGVNVLIIMAGITTGGLANRQPWQAV